jgi:hypothetical protein
MYFNGKHHYLHFAFYLMEFIEYDVFEIKKKTKKHQMHKNSISILHLKYIIFSVPPSFFFIIFVELRLLPKKKFKLKILCNR